MQLAISGIVLFITMATTTASNQHLICKSVNDVFDNSASGHIGNGTKLRAGAQGRPGKIGPVGPRGFPGVRGLKGEEGYIDYNNISEIVERKVCEGLAAVMAGLKDLRQDVINLHEDMKVIECSTSNLLHGGVCYRMTNYSSSRLLNRESAKLACSRIGYKLARIRNRIHQKALENLVRPLIPESHDQMHLWIDLIYNLKGNTLQYESGEKVTAGQVIWYPGYPSSAAGRQYILLGVRKTGDDGIWNPTNNSNGHGVLCEKHMAE